MPTVNGPDEITDLEAGNDKVFYSDSSGDITEVALGAAATVLTSAGATSAPTFAVIPADATVGANKTMYTNNSDVESGVAFGAAGTVLTSGGTDATATPPTWAVPAGGDTLSFTANGALTAGYAASLDAAGTVSAAADTLAGNTVGTTPFTNWELLTGPAQKGNSTSVYDPENDVHVVMAQSYNGAGGSPYYHGILAKCVTSNSSDLTYTITSAASASLAVGVSDDGNNTFDLCWDIAGQVGLAFTRNATTGYLYVCPFTTSGSGTSAAVTFGTNTLVASGANYSGGLAYIDGLGNSILTYGNSGGLYAVDITPAGSGSTAAPTIGTPVQFYTVAMNNNDRGVYPAYDVGNDAITVVWYDDTLGYMYYVVGTVSGGSTTWGTPASFSAELPADAGILIGYRSADDKWIAAWSKTSSNVLVTACGTRSGTTMSWSVKLFTSADTGWYKWSNLCMQRRDDGLGRVTVVGYERAGYGYVNFIITLGLSGGQYVLDLSTYTQLPNPNGTGITNGGGNAGCGASYSPDTQRYVINAFAPYAPTAAGIYAPVTGADNTDFTIGVAQTSVTTGQTVEVKSIGTTTTAGMSLLTPRDKMYVQANGTVSSVSTSQQIGVATAADTVLITKIGTSIT